jgi:manganese/iron transport system permease protein
MAELWQWLAEPLSFPFMQRALIVALLVSSVCAVLSCFLVLKGWSLMGDAVSHAVLPGIVVAYVVGVPLALGAFATGLLCALATGYIRANSRVKEDTVLGIVFAGLFALGIFLFTKVETDQHLTHVLFGNLLGTTPEDMKLLMMISLPVLAVMLAFRHTFMLYVFDASQARALGFPVPLLHFGLLALLAATAVAALKAVGVILVVAMLVTPGATAFLLARRFSGMIVIAWGVALFASLAGVFLSFHFDLPTGPLIVVVQFGLFLLALLWARLAGARAAELAAESR